MGILEAVETHTNKYTSRLLFYCVGYSIKQWYQDKNKIKNIDASIQHWNNTSSSLASNEAINSIK